MRSLPRIALMTIIAAASVFVSGNVLAQAPGCCSPDAYGPYGVLRRANRRVIPYFAEHPPVYYSYPVARPYGFSPYALPPGVLPVEMNVAPKPQEIINPYFQPQGDDDSEASDETTTTTSDRTAATILNPLVQAARAGVLAAAAR